MKHYIIDLKAQYPVQGGRLECILADCPYDIYDENWVRPAVLIVPGGGYRFNSKREGEPTAHYFLPRGFQAFVLNYLCAPDGVRYPEQLNEISCAVDFIRKNAKEYHVNPEEIFVVGFSAGGHLTANLAVDWQNSAKRVGKEIDCRPTAIALAYPVIYEEGHEDSYVKLLTGYEGEERVRLVKRLELDKRVTEKTPPAFLWSTGGDDFVPPENAVRFARAMAKNKLLYELHIYPQGGHGSSVCNYEVNKQKNPWLKRNSRWLEDCESFFRLFITEDF